MIENRVKFLKTMTKLELYFVKLEENSVMKTKFYLENCQVGGNDCRLVICITHDECTFLTNDAKLKI